MKLFNPIAWFKKKLQERAEIKKRRKETLERVLADYNKLIEEYRLIQERKSTLSKKQRDFVVLRIKHLIHKGHIVVKK